MENKTKKYKIDGDTFYYRPCAWAYIEFEQLTGKPFAEAEDTVKDTLSLIWACTVAGMKIEGKPFDMDFEAYVLKIDDNLSIISELAGEVTEKK